MDQSRREYRARRTEPVHRTGRHHRSGRSGVRARRAVVAVVVGLAVGSAAIGAARGQTDQWQVSAVLVDHPAGAQPAAATATPSSAASTATTAGSTPTAVTSRTPTASRSTSASPSPKASSVPQRGNGKLVPVLVPGKDSARKGRVITYAFEVEDGLGIDRAAAAKIVGSALRDARGWEQVDGLRFVQVTPQQRATGTKPAVTISLVSPKKTDAMCAPLQTKSTWSCANKDHAVLNYRRWVMSTPSFASLSVKDYRHYVVNHEVGHELGHSHVGCDGPGKPAPVMMQQSMGVKKCKPNVWPNVTRG